MLKKHFEMMKKVISSLPITPHSFWTNCEYKSDDATHFSVEDVVKDINSLGEFDAI